MRVPGSFLSVWFAAPAVGAAYPLYSMRWPGQVPARWNVLANPMKNTPECCPDPVTEFFQKTQLLSVTLPWD